MYHTQHLNVYLNYSMLLCNTAYRFVRFCFVCVVGLCSFFTVTVMDCTTEAFVLECIELIASDIAQIMLSQELANAYGLPIEITGL